MVGSNPLLSSPFRGTPMLMKCYLWAKRTWPTALPCILMISDKPQSGVIHTTRKWPFEANGAMRYNHEITMSSTHIDAKHFKIPIDRVYQSITMKGTNTCAWLLLGTVDVCGKSCLGEHCKAHNARLAKGGGTFPCTGCGRPAAQGMPDSRNGGTGSTSSGKSLSV